MGVHSAGGGPQVQAHRAGDSPDADHQWETSREYWGKYSGHVISIIQSEASIHVIWPGLHPAAGEDDREGENQEGFTDRAGNINWVDFMVEWNTKDNESC